MLYHARAWGRHQAVAGQLASRIVSLQAERPDRPIILVGHSGGGAMAVVALEQLPPGASVHQAILLAPDISPYHCLAAALSRTECGIDLFRSPFDLLALGVGTTLVGTIDRFHGPAAGLVGFHSSGGADEDARFLYSLKLREHPYSPSMVRTGHFGGHFTVTLPDFVSRYVTPTIR
jgi:pimeloyl-ACP methyl ester carboxylesterase